MMKNNFKIFKKKLNQSSRGITLIALVITIIVLLILAGVTISTLTGENGLLTKANQAKVENERAGEKDLIQLAYQAAKMEEYQNTDSSKTFVEFLEEELEANGLAGAMVTDNGDETYTVTLVNENEYSVNSNGIVEYAKDTSGANIPELYDGMQAIKLASDGTPILVTDTTKNDWYSYKVQTGRTETYNEKTEEYGTSHWANATLNGNYYVWIPRYAYKIYDDSSEEGYEKYDSQSGSSYRIDVKFIGTDVTQTNIADKLGTSYADYIVHPAFTFGTVGETTTRNELSGIWVGKYETSEDNGNTKILPNVTSLRNINVSTMFSKAQTLSTTKYDAHMMKNIEWGAVAYLAQSQYGRNGTEISVNQCTGYITGAGRGLNSTEDSTKSGTGKIYNSKYDIDSETGLPTAEQQYNGKIGKLSSTTGNIYGVYDMSGGANEYVMGFYGTAGNPTKGYTGFGTFPESKYYDLYTTLASTSSQIGAALYETKAWNSDYADFVNYPSPVFIRGGSYNDGASRAGAFYFCKYLGGNDGYCGFRVTLAVQ